MELSRLSLLDFRQGTPERRQAFAHQITQSFTKCGFVKLDDHGFDANAIHEMFEWSRRFFQLPREVRQSCAHVPGPNPQRGYSAIGGENLANFHSLWTGKTPPKGSRDDKELYDIGPEADDEFPTPWPKDSELPGFRKYLQSTYRQFEHVTYDVLEALEMGLGVKPGSFTHKCINHASEFRFVYYPPANPKEFESGVVSRAWPHYDIGVVSFLFQDDVGGLEMSDGCGGFVPVVAERPTDLIVNGAETLQRWSNGILKAGLHRVTIPRSIALNAEGNIPERYSAVYFCKANREASVAPLSELVDMERPALYDDMTALQYHQKRVVAAYS